MPCMPTGSVMKLCASTKTPASVRRSPEIKGWLHGSGKERHIMPFVYVNKYIRNALAGIACSALPGRR